MPIIKSPDTILKLADAMEKNGFIDMEISPEEFCDLVNYHGARLRKLNWNIPFKKHPIQTWMEYTPQERKEKNYNKDILKTIKQNPKKRFYSQLTFQEHTLISEHWQKIVRLEGLIGL
tara:strand:- start:575 stop:928 length:354 start_codon:yes stop_codon:yes gene_type:complete